jgi:threonine synthase
VSLLVEHARELGAEPRSMAAVSIAEQMRIAGPALDYRGVQIDLLDESSLMHTGTFKSSLAAVAVADALARGRAGFVTVSAGNTAQAMAAYAAPHGLECFLFVTAVSHYKLDRRLLAHPNVHLFEIDRPEQELKRLGAAFGRRAAVLTLPTPEQQLTGNKVRALYLAGQHREGRPRYDWIAQSLSGGFGPLGFYEGIAELAARGHWPAGAAPALLGVQQEGNCPLAARSKAAQPNGRVPLLEPTLYATRPAGAAGLRQIVGRYGGAIRAVSNRSYLAREDEFIERVQQRGITCGRALLAPGRPPVERSGLLALAGVFEAVERGIIPRGSRVLVCFTGGCSPDLTEPVEPELTLWAGEPMDRFWRAVAGYLGNAAPALTV